MSEIEDAFLAKALESLPGAESELQASRFNNCANRCYYGCFQAAVAALDRAGIRPSRAEPDWGHSFVESQVVGVLVNRRKMYPSDLRGTLGAIRRLREAADYRVAAVGRAQAERAIRTSRRFVVAVEQNRGVR